MENKENLEFSIIHFTFFAFINDDLSRLLEYFRDKSPRRLLKILSTFPPFQQRRLFLIR
jgi:hypothetical protein